ncbi:MAG: hypothetical protein K6B46_00205 [Opitutales bacterium]|nr:hypothetical protein [Opitutales bacterium]
MDYSLEELLPHRKPMILVGGIENCDLDDYSLTAWACFDKNSIFYDPEIDGVPAYVGIELMAQSVGLFSGIFARERENRAPRIGFLLGARTYKNSLSKFETGKKYFIHVRQTYFLDGFGKTHCRIFENSSEGTPVAESELNVYLTQNDKIEDALALLKK